MGLTKSDVRPMVRADLAAVGAIQSASPGASQWNPASYLEYASWVIESDGAVVGFTVTRPAGPGESEILNLVVAPESRRMGFARQLMASVLPLLADRIFLEVRESNAAARKLYSNLGFVLCGVRPGYYHDPDEAAIVMMLQK